MRMGMISDRRRRRRAARMRRRCMVAAGVLLLGALAMAPGLREKLRSLSWDAQVFSSGAQQAERMLPEREIYALQLAVFDSGERAASEARRLQAKGVRCIVWQREKMRIVSSVAPSRDALDLDTARGEESCVIRDTMEAVPLRLSCGAAEMAQVQTLLETPDSALTRLLTGEPGGRQSPGPCAVHPAGAEPCQLVRADGKDDGGGGREKRAQLRGGDDVHPVPGAAAGASKSERGAAVTHASGVSTASAQRTPPTAAEVMPPA